MSASTEEKNTHNAGRRHPAVPFHRYILGSMPFAAVLIQTSYSPTVTAALARAASVQPPSIIRRWGRMHKRAAWEAGLGGKPCKLIEVVGGTEVPVIIVTSI